MYEYAYTSPLKKDWLVRKLLKFTMPVSVLPYSGDDLVKDLSQFDDVKLNHNIIFALISSNPQIQSLFSEVAEDNRERFYFFTQQAQEKQDSKIVAVGNNFTKSFPLSAKPTKQDLESILSVGQAQDLLILNHTTHLSNTTYLASLDSKLLIVALAGLETDYLTTDFLYDFRRFAQEYRYSLDKYAFAILNLDDEESFKWLTTWQLGRFDSPSIFAIRGPVEKGEYYRNYHTYYGSGNISFENISTQFVSEINTGKKMPLYREWIDSWKNLYNLEYWANNKMKAYIYIIGLVSIVALPLLVIVDCFMPILGRGPNAKRKKE